MDSYNNDINDMKANHRIRNNNYINRSFLGLVLPRHKSLYTTPEIDFEQPIASLKTLMPDGPRVLQMLYKFYQKNDCYSGSNNLIDTLLQIFYDLCYKTGIGKNNFDITLPAILIGDAKEYYY
jgi:hypothetical protein